MADHAAPQQVGHTMSFNTLGNLPKIHYICRIMAHPQGKRPEERPGETTDEKYRGEVPRGTGKEEPQRGIDKGTQPRGNGWGGFY